MNRIVALVDEDTSLGFMLSGIEAEKTETPEEMKRQIESLMVDREVRVVVLDEQLFRQLPQHLQREIEESLSPIFVPIPTIRLWRGVTAPEEYLGRLIRRVIGYQIKIRR